MKRIEIVQTLTGHTHSDDPYVRNDKTGGHNSAELLRLSCTHKYYRSTAPQKFDY